MDVDYSVESFFTPESSWHIPERVTPHILKHEQAHFDISELHARMLRKNLEGRTFSKKVKSEIESIYQEIEQKRRAMQTKFDAETDHSRNEVKEAFWQKYITNQLAEYDAWK
jgi:predicted secreted Zn-dependent protease